MTAREAFAYGLGTGLLLSAVMLVLVVLGCARASAMAQRAEAIERRERERWERAMHALTGL